MPLNKEQQALLDEVESAMQQARTAPMRRDKCFSWQCLTINQAMSRMYVAGMKAKELGMTGNYHQWHIDNAKETHQ